MSFAECFAHSANSRSLVVSLPLKRLGKNKKENLRAHSQQRPTPHAASRARPRASPAKLHRRKLPGGFRCQRPPGGLHRQKPLPEASTRHGRRSDARPDHRRRPWPKPRRLPPRVPAAKSNGRRRPSPHCLSPPPPKPAVALAHHRRPAGAVLPPHLHSPPHPGASSPHPLPLIPILLRSRVLAHLSFLFFLGCRKLTKARKAQRFKVWVILPLPNFHSV